MINEWKRFFMEMVIPFSRYCPLSTIHYMATSQALKEACSISDEGIGKILNNILGKFLIT
jgi:hypothetical protein